MSNLQRTLLLAILAYALLSRLAGVAWGLELFDRHVGDSRYHPDEFKVAVGAKNFPKDILSRTDLRYPTGLHYMVGILGFPARAAWTALDDIQLYLLTGRLLSVAFGVAAVYLTYRLARHFAGVNAGLIAAALLAVSVYAVRESALATTDMAVSFWAVVVLLLTAKLTPESGWKTYLLLGITAGILIGTKYSGAFALIPFAIWLAVGVFNPAPSRPALQKTFSLAAICFVSASFTFLLTTPSILVHPEAFLSSLRYESERLAQLRSPLWHPSVFLYFFTSLAEAANLFIALAAMIALVYIIIKRPAVQLAAYAVLIVSFYLYFNTALAARYWTLVLPPLCVLIGYSFERFNASTNRVPAFFGVGLLTLCITTGVYQDYQLARLLSNDTRSRAAQFIEHLPENSTFQLGANSPEADGWQYPFVPEPALSGPAEIPGYLILSEFADQLPDDGVLDVQVGDKNNTYREIAVFEPIEALKVEFLSPVIAIFERGQ